MTSREDDNSPRSAGVLLHPTSLPGPYGIGDLGDAAYRWIDALAGAQQTWWQILPLTPTGFGDSPYQSFSAFAGNPYLVSPDLLIRDGLLPSEGMACPFFHLDRIDYGPVIDFKTQLLTQAWQRFDTDPTSGLRSEFETFQHEHQAWLDDYALFRAIKDAQNGASWYDWPRDLIERTPTAMETARGELRPRLDYHKFTQFLFWRQWGDVKRYAESKNISIIGDAPIFVAADSADVWANQALFQLDAKSNPKVVAGVPPDYFSATGQLWGNPLYDWQKMEQSEFQWWIDRLKLALHQVDQIRLDHFRGFEAYWEVPARDATAENGQWVKAPGEALFQTLLHALGSLPIIAEDLGLITEEVHDLRDQFAMPGMRVLQFAFGGGNDNPYLPHNYDHNTVVYTGTHDNDTTRGWYEKAADHDKDHLRRYLGTDGRDIAWDFLRAAWSSVANYAIAPLQDILDLGSDARMNFPGEAQGNWGWRYRDEMLTAAVLDRLADMTELYGR